MKTIRRILNFAEYAFTIVSLILYTGGILNVVITGGVSEGDLNYDRLTTDTDSFLIVKIIYPLTYAISLLLLTRISRKSPKISDIFLRNPYVLMVVGFAVLSITWSELPDITISRSIALVGTTIFGIYLANRYTVKEQLILLGHTCWAILLLSIIFVVALPQYGIMGAIHAGAIRGIYSHKNEFGRLMALSAVVFLMQPRRSSPNRILELQARFINSRKNAISRSRNSLPIETQKDNFLSSLFHLLYVYFGFGLSIILLLLSRSSGAIVNLIFLLTVVTIFKIIKLPSYQRFFAILGITIVLSIIAVFVVPDPEILFASIGKSSDLTGRSDLWNILFDMLSQKPLLGFGYTAFWEKYKNVIAPYNAGWAAPDAHNGFLDLTLSVGLIGLTLFAVSYLYTVSKGFTRFRYRPTAEQFWPLILLAYIAISNTSETGLFDYNKIYWLLYVMVGYSVITRSEKPILALPESRVKKPILALPEARRREQIYLSEARRRKTFLALPEVRNSNQKALPPARYMRK